MCVSRAVVPRSFAITCLSPRLPTQRAVPPMSQPDKRAGPPGAGKLGSRRGETRASTLSGLFSCENTKERGIKGRSLTTVCARSPLRRKRIGPACPPFCNGVPSFLFLARGRFFPSAYPVHLFPPALTRYNRRNVLYRYQWFFRSKSMARPGTAARIADLLERLARDAMAQFGDIADEDF